MKNSLEGLISLDLVSTKLFCFRARVYCSVLFVYLSRSCETFQRALWRPSGNCWTPWTHFDLKLNFILVVTSKLQVFAKHNRTIIINCYCNTLFYYKASSVSGQDDPNRALWLATRAGEMEPSCPLGTTRCILQAKLNPLLTKFVRSRWLDIGQVFFCVFMDRDEVDVHKLAKKNEANIQPSWSNKLGQ